MPVLLAPLLIGLAFAIRTTLGACNFRRGRFYRSRELRRCGWIALAIWVSGIFAGAVWAVVMVRPHYTVFSQFVMTLGAVLQVLLSPVLGGGLPRNDPTSIYQLYTLLSLVVFAAGVVLAALDKQTRWGTARKRKRAVRERARSTEALVAFFSYVVAGVFAHLMHQPYCHHWAAYCSNEALVATVVQPSQSDAAYECQCSWPLRALGVRGNGPVLPILAALEAHKGVLADAHAPEGKKAKYRCLLGLVVRMNGSEAEAAVTTIRSWKLAPWSQTVANSSGDFVQRECRRQ